MHVLSATELHAMLRERYPSASVFVADGTYNIPTEAAFDVYRRELANELLDKYGDRWRDFFDCDNFAIEAVALAARKHYLARMEGKGNAQGVAVGVLQFRTNPSDPASGHAINWRIRPDLTVAEFEPQDRKDLKLTNLQCASAWLCFC